MGVEITGAKRKKRELRSPPEDPSDQSIFLERTKKTVLEFLKYGATAPPTPYPRRPFNPKQQFEFLVQSPKEAGLCLHRAPIPFLAQGAAIDGGGGLVHLANQIMGGGGGTVKEKVERKSAKQEKLGVLEKGFVAGNPDFQFLAELTNPPRQEMGNLWTKSQDNKLIFKDHRNQRKKLNQIHCNYILAHFDKPENFDKTILELYTDPKVHFNPNGGDVSFWAIYDYVHLPPLAHKKIIYKVGRANIPPNKLGGAQVATGIAPAHLASFGFMCIGGISFNLGMGQEKGWGLRGGGSNMHKPPKSGDYSCIAAMGISGYAGIKIAKGGVKGPEFISFMLDLCKCGQGGINKKKIPPLMGNASVHRPKKFMQIFAGYHNVLYGAPYTPQLNAIEFSFSKLKYLAKKAGPIPEKDLVGGILSACNQVTKKDCAEFIAHSPTFVEKSIKKEDLF